MVLAGCQTTATGEALDNACLQDDDNDLAITSCTTIINNGQASGNLDYVWAHISRGDSYQQKGDITRALKDYNTALELAPENPDAFYNRGRLYAEVGNYRAALRDFDQSVRYSPDEKDVYNERGLSWAAVNEHDKAFADFEKALSLDPNYGFAITNRGFSHRATGNYAAALSDWDKGIQIGGAEEVRWWQDYLLAAKYYNGPSDGEDSAAFRAALKRCSQRPTC